MTKTENVRSARPQRVKVYGFRDEDVSNRQASGLEVAST